MGASPPCQVCAISLANAGVRVLLILFVVVGPGRDKGNFRAPPRPQWGRSGVAAFMSAHSKTPYITPYYGFFLWGWGSTGAQGGADGIFLAGTDL